MLVLFSCGRLVTGCQINFFVVENYGKMFFSVIMIIIIIIVILRCIHFSKDARNFFNHYAALTNFLKKLDHFVLIFQTVVTVIMLMRKFEFFLIVFYLFLISLNFNIILIIRH